MLSCLETDNCASFEPLWVLPQNLFPVGRLTGTRKCWQCPPCSLFLPDIQLLNCQLVRKSPLPLFVHLRWTTFEHLWGLTACVSGLSISTHFYMNKTPPPDLGWRSILFTLKHHLDFEQTTTRVKMHLVCTFWNQMSDQPIHAFLYFCQISQSRDLLFFPLTQIP